MFDSGLWDACGESRKMIKKRHTFRDWWNLLDEHRVESWSIMHSHGQTPVDRIHALGTFTASGERRTLAISPKSDLLCLQPFDHNKIDWGGVGGCILLFNLGVRHVALEYNPIWEVEAVRSQDPSYRPRAGECFQDTKAQALGCVAGAATESMLWARHLWFIDYRIHRSSGSHPEKDRQIFYGMGCRFVEVQRGDPEWEISVQEGHGTTIYNFLDVLDSKLNLHFHVEYRPGKYYFEDVESPRYFNPAVGVLACEQWK